MLLLFKIKVSDFKVIEQFPLKVTVSEFAEIVFPFKVIVADFEDISFTF